MTVIDAPTKSDSLSSNDTNNKWQAPTPMVPTNEHTLPYPIDALPGIIQNAITAYQQYGQQPLSNSR